MPFIDPNFPGEQMPSGTNSIHTVDTNGGFGALVGKLVIDNDGETWFWPSSMSGAEHFPGKFFVKFTDPGTGPQNPATWSYPADPLSENVEQVTPETVPSSWSGPLQRWRIRKVGTSGDIGYLVMKGGHTRWCLYAGRTTGTGSSRVIAIDANDILEFDSACNTPPTNHYHWVNEERVTS